MARKSKKELKRQVVEKSSAAIRILYENPDCLAAVDEAQQIVDAMVESGEIQDCHLAGDEPTFLDDWDVLAGPLEQCGPHGASLFLAPGPANQPERRRALPLRVYLRPTAKILYPAVAAYGSEEDVISREGSVDLSVDLTFGRTEVKNQMSHMLDDFFDLRELLGPITESEHQQLKKLNRRTLDDLKMRELRARGATWKEVGAEFSVSRFAARRRVHGLAQLGLEVPARGSRSNKPFCATCGNPRTCTGTERSECYWARVMNEVTSGGERLLKEVIKEGKIDYLVRKYADIHPGKDLLPSTPPSPIDSE